MQLQIHVQTQSQPDTAMRGEAPAPAPPPPDVSHHPTPIWISHRLHTSLVVAGVVLLAVAVWRVPDIVSIVLGAVIVALLLSFPVGWLSHVLPRGLAVLVTLVLLVGLIVVALAWAVPLLVNQLTDLVTALPQIQRALSRVMDEAVRELQSRRLLPDDGATQANLVRGQVGTWVRNLAIDLLSGLLGWAQGSVGFFLRLVSIITLAIYLVLDAEKARDSFIDLAPTRYSHDAALLWDTFSRSIARYLGGLIFIAGVSGMLSTGSLWLIGVPYALLLGVWVAFTSFIPIFGTYIGVVPALFLALSQSTTSAVLTLLSYVAIQQLQDNVLTPRIQGQTAKVPPALVLVSVLWTGFAFGLLWSVLAVPALVIGRVLFDFFRVRLHVRPAPSTRADQP